MPCDLSNSLESALRTDQTSMAAFCAFAQRAILQQNLHWSSYSKCIFSDFNSLIEVTTIIPLIVTPILPLINLLMTTPIIPPIPAVPQSWHCSNTMVFRHPDARCHHKNTALLYRLKSSCVSKRLRSDCCSMCHTKSLRAMKCAPQS